MNQDLLKIESVAMAAANMNACAYNAAVNAGTERLAKDERFD